MKMAINKAISVSNKKKVFTKNIGYQSPIPENEVKQKKEEINYIEQFKETINENEKINFKFLEKIILDLKKKNSKNDIKIEHKEVKMIEFLIQN
jgi:hypothetical protein